MDKTRAWPSPTRGVTPGAVLAVMKPVTWFAPIWAFACGAIAGSGHGSAFDWRMLVAGVVLAGPLVCGASQALNEWCDREVDAINQPERPIPSGRLPGQTGLYVAIVLMAVAFGYALLLGPLVSVAAALALAAGWAYSAPPFRLKTSGWWGPGLTAFAYEGLAWITGALVMGHAAALWQPRLVVFALLYSIGAHGIMTLNDFKAIEGDRALGIRSLPAVMGPARAVKLACLVMAVPQAVVALLLAIGGMPVRSGAIVVLLAVQIGLMRRLVRDPERLAPWYNGTGVTLYVAGMMIAAFAVRAGVGG